MRGVNIRRRDRSARQYDRREPVVIRDGERRRIAGLVREIERERIANERAEIFNDFVDSDSVFRQNRRGLDY